MLMPMLSYAQNGEDVVLRRVFADRPSGFYVDVGACDPVDDSVTHYFYEHGWHGVNIEPDARFHARLVAARPRDVNLLMAIGTSESTVAFYPTRTRGHGTLDSTIAAERHATDSETVQQSTLAKVLTDYAPPEGVDFLKVDVEGWESQVLRSANWQAIRPRIVLVEAIDANGRPSHAAWEGGLLAAGYQFALFDGVNRFYCRNEDAATLLPRLAAPACVLDNWRLAREVFAQEAGTRAHDEATRHLAAVLVSEQAAHEKTRDSLAKEQIAHALTRDGLAKERAAHAMTGYKLAEEQAVSAAIRAALSDVLVSTSWRVTAPLRSVMRLLRLVRPGG